MNFDVKGETDPSVPSSNFCLKNTWSRRVVLLTLLASTAILLFGIFSDVHLGDEPFHTMLAMQIYTEKSRPIINPLICSNPAGGDIKLDTEVLWHTGLALLWAATGGCSSEIAQLYQTAFYALLIIATYLVTCNIYDKKIGCYAAFLIATMPLITSHSIILLTDIPVAVFCTFSFLMLLQKRFLYSGILLGMAFLVKRNAYFMAPPFGLLVLLSTEGGLKNRIRQALVFSIPAIVVNIPDLYFRITKLGSAISPASPETANLSPLYTSPEAPYVFIHPESITGDPSNFFKYMGITLLLGVGVYLWRRLYNSRDFSLWLTIILYCVFYVYFFHQGHLAMRYLSPIVPMIAIVGAVGLASIKNKWLINAIVILSVLQFGASTYHTYNKRALPPDIKKAYKFIRHTTPKESRILAVEGGALSLHTGRICMWDSSISMLELPYLFWKANNEEVKNILAKYDVNYILIEAHRTYDDSSTKHVMGYPESFVKKLKTFPCLNLVFKNDGTQIWQLVK